MIKIKLRRNLLYLFVYFIAWIITTVFEELMSCSSYVYLSLAILSKIFGGLILWANYKANRSHISWVKNPYSYSKT